MGHTPDIYGRLWNKKGEPYTKDKIQNKYTPHLPYSVIDNMEPEPEPELCQYDVNKNTYGGGKEGEK